MKRFVFPLKAILSLRKAACTQAKQAYARAVMRTHQAAQELEACLQGIEAAQEAQNQSLTPGEILDTQAVVRTARFLEAEQKKRLFYQHQHQACLEAQHGAFMQYWKKKQALESLEDLKGRQAQEHMEVQLKQEESEQQELFSKTPSSFLNP